ncbi:TerB family tellurite resistance protein [Agathobaculum butyriciproducens]|uniref:TerB family tellurite resistance protein n=1 Tax=Agathobaculum butyriciproducens TaxID=1628085 RepID=UPI002098561B|nr:TerB family tellurite resistance protein [Agathobaculum butyriciproducens]
MMEHTEKIAYLKALIYIATADDTIDESEREKFSQLGHIYGLNEDEINSIADSVINKTETLEEILGNISTRQTKLLLVYDLLAICYADGCYSLAEKNAMRSIVNMLHIEEEKLTALEEVIEESTVLNKKLETILEK